MGWSCGSERYGREQRASPVSPRARGSPALPQGLAGSAAPAFPPLRDLPACAGTSSECSHPEFSRSPLFVAVKTQTSQSSKKSSASLNRCSSLLHRSPSGVPPASQSQMFRTPNSGSTGSKAITGTSSFQLSGLLHVHSYPGFWPFLALFSPIKAAPRSS